MSRATFPVMPPVRKFDLSVFSIVMLNVSSSWIASWISSPVLIEMFVASFGSFIVIFLSSSILMVLIHFVGLLIIAWNCRVVMFVVIFVFEVMLISSVMLTSGVMFIGGLVRLVSGVMLISGFGISSFGFSIVSEMVIINGLLSIEPEGLLLCFL